MRVDRVASISRFLLGNYCQKSVLNALRMYTSLKNKKGKRGTRPHSILEKSYLLLLPVRQIIRSKDLPCHDDCHKATLGTKMEGIQSLHVGFFVKGFFVLHNRDIQTTPRFEVDH